MSNFPWAVPGRKYEDRDPAELILADYPGSYIMEEEVTTEFGRGTDYEKE